jgi:uncharacterized protein YciI
MFLLVSTYSASLDVMDELLPAHREYLQRHLDDGVFVLWGRQVPRTGGVIVAQGVDRQQVEAIAADDPFVQANAASYQVIEVQPTGGLAELTSLLPSS